MLLLPPSILRASLALASACTALGCSTSDGDSNTEDGGPAATDALLACEVDAPCASSRADLLEGFDITSYGAEAATCLLTSLRDRVPGRYLHEQTSASSQGTDVVTHVIIVHADGSVSYAWTSRYDGEYLGDDGEYATGKLTTHGEALGCDVAPSTELDACLDAIAAHVDPAPSSAVSSCLRVGDGRPVPWLASCSPQAARCE